MSVRMPAASFSRQPQEKYFTPHPVAWKLADQLRRADATLFDRCQLWEPAAGCGNIADVLTSECARVFASDVEPDAPHIARLDFLASSGPSGERPLGIITNPPYGEKSALALSFIAHGLDLMKKRNGFLALLLPFEFDAVQNRNALFSQNPLFAAKLTLGRRIRWSNLPQKRSSPMGHHAWFIWSAQGLLLSNLRRMGQMRVI